LLVSGTATGVATYDPAVKKGLGKPAVILAALFALVTVAGVAVVGVWVVRNFGPAVVRDHTGMGAVQHRLRPVQADLSAVPSPPHTHPAAAATFTGCVSDSGEIFQPQVSREWRLTRDARGSEPYTGYDRLTGAARKAGAEITQALLARGWTGRPPHGPNAATTLRRPGPNKGSYISIQVFYDSVLATARTSHDRVCGRIL
jgi:hypothetical protein